MLLPGTIFNRLTASIARLAESMCAYAGESSVDVPALVHVLNLAPMKPLCVYTLPRDSVICGIGALGLVLASRPEADLIRHSLNHV
jgi:hypothetical protein